MGVSLVYFLCVAIQFGCVIFGLSFSICFNKWTAPLTLDFMDHVPAYKSESNVPTLTLNFLSDKKEMNNKG